MTQESPRDPMAAVNELLSEIIDVALALRQAHRRVPEAHELHAQLDELVSDARSWAELLMEADTARGVSALAYMPSVTGRQRPDLGHGSLSDDDVRRILAERLDQLASHIRAALAQPEDDDIRDLLNRINAELQAHLTALR
jgi:DNA-binding ferritin-like protein